MLKKVCLRALNLRPQQLRTLQALNISNNRTIFAANQVRLRSLSFPIIAILLHL